jgi:hypothetical protein
MLSPALQGPLVVSRCIIDRSATYLGRPLGALPNRLTKTFESKLLIIGKGPSRKRWTYRHPTAFGTQQPEASRGERPPGQEDGESPGGTQVYGREVTPYRWLVNGLNR